MQLSFVFLCLSLATLSLASIPSVEEKRSSLSSKNLRKPSGKKVKADGSTSSAADQFSRAAKKLVWNIKEALKKRQKKRVGATKGVTSAGAGEMSPAGSGSGKSGQGSAVLGFFPKVIVELIGEYLEGFSVVFTRDWSAVYSQNRVAVDSERHYLITAQYIQASSHSDGEQANIGSPDLSYYGGFQSSYDGCSLFFTGKTKEQVSIFSSKKTFRWLVQEAGAESLKSVTLESDETSVGDSFILSANGKTLLSTLFKAAPYTDTTSVYQVKEHGKAASASKKTNFDGYAIAVSRNGNRMLLKCNEKKRFEVHDISGNESRLVLKISYAGIIYLGSYALNTDGSKAAFIFADCKLYIVDVDKQKGSVSVDRLTPIDIPSPALCSSLIYDVKDRLCAFKSENLWLVDSSKCEFISLEKAEVPQGYEILSSAASPNADYIALLIRSKDKNKEGEHQYRMVVKGDAKVVFMRLCGYKS